MNTCGKLGLFSECQIQKFEGNWLIDSYVLELQGKKFYNVEIRDVI